MEGLSYFSSKLIIPLINIYAKINFFTAEKKVNFIVSYYCRQNLRERTKVEHENKMKKSIIILTLDEGMGRPGLLAMIRSTMVWNLVLPFPLQTKS